MYYNQQLMIFPTGSSHRKKHLQKILLFRWCLSCLMLSAIFFPESVGVLPYHAYYNNLVFPVVSYPYIIVIFSYLMNILNRKIRTDNQCFHNYFSKSSIVIHGSSFSCFNCLSFVKNISHPLTIAVAICKASIALKFLY